MLAPFSYRSIVIVALVLSSWAAVAQKGSPGRGGPPSNPGIGAAGTDPSMTQPLYVSGNVIIEGGSSAPAAVAIQRVCNGSLRREGYTDSKGRFQFQLGSEAQQDASENDTRTSNPQQMKSPGQSNRSNYDGCELRALLPGFQSSSVLLHIVAGDFGEVRVGTIVLTRQANAEGTTVSVVSMAAPKNAQQAFEKGRKAQGEKKFDQAVDELNQAVRLYPNYAAAWYLLGEIHRTQKQTDQAIQEYKQALSADAQFVNPYFGLSLIAIDQKRWQDAHDLTDHLIKLNPSAFPLAFFYSSAANFNLGQLDEAEKSARKFQSLDPGHSRPEVCLLLESILEAKQDYAGAAQQLRDYLALVPGSPLAEEIRADVARLEKLNAAKSK